MKMSAIRRFATIAFVVTSAMVATFLWSIPGPGPRSEDIRALLEKSSFVCKGIVLELLQGQDDRRPDPDNKFTLASRMMALVRVDQVFKGSTEKRQIAIKLSTTSNPLLIGSRIRAGDYGIFFLISDVDGDYLFVDDYHARIPIPQALPGVAPPSTPRDPVTMLEHEFRGALESKDPAVRIDAVWNLGALGSISASDDLKVLITPDDYQQNGAIYVALMRLGDYTMLGQAIDFVEYEAQDVDVRVAQSFIIKAIGNIQDEALLTKLHYATLSSSNESLRLNAIRALRSIRSIQSIPILISMLDDDSADVRYGAVMALAAITGKGREWAPARQLFDLGDSEYTRRWKQWWSEQETQGGG